MPLVTPPGSMWGEGPYMRLSVTEWCTQPPFPWFLWKSPLLWLCTECALHAFGSACFWHHLLQTFWISTSDPIQWQHCSRRSVLRSERGNRRGCGSGSPFPFFSHMMSLHIHPFEEIICKGLSPPVSSCRIFLPRRLPLTQFFWGEANLPPPFFVLP